MCHQLLHQTKWLPAKKNVHPVTVPVSDLEFKNSKLDKCYSKTAEAKEAVCSVKRASIALRAPIEEDQEL